MIRHPHDFRMFRHPHIYRMSRHPHGPRATQPSDDLPSTRFSSADANTGQGPHSTGDDLKTGHANISEDPWWVAGKLSALTWFRSCRLGSGCPSVGLSCFVFCPVTGVCLFLLGRQPKNWPFPVLFRYPLPVCLTPLVCSMDVAYIFIGSFSLSCCSQDLLSRCSPHSSGALCPRTC